MNIQASDSPGKRQKKRKLLRKLSTAFVVMNRKPREVKLDREHTQYMDNSIMTTKYTVINFLPKNLIE